MPSVYSSVREALPLPARRVKLSPGVNDPLPSASSCGARVRAPMSVLKVITRSPAGVGSFDLLLQAAAQRAVRAAAPHIAILFMCFMSFEFDGLFRFDCLPAATRYFSGCTEGYFRVQMSRRRSTAPTLMTVIRAVGR